MKEDLSATAAAGNSLDCSARKTTSTVDGKVKDALDDEFDNPYNNAARAISLTGLTGCTADGMEGTTSIVDDGNLVTVKTCINDVDADLVTNIIQIE